MGRVTNLRGVAELRRVVQEFENAGWQFKRPGTTDTVADGPSIYVLDVETGRPFLVVTLAGSIEKDSARLAESGLTHKDAVDGLGTVVDELVGGRVAFDEEHRRILYLAAEAYVAGTRAYATARDQGLLQNCAFLVLRYDDHGANCKLLRPITIPYQRVLSPDMIQSAASQTLALDRQMHPERFARAKVLSLRVRPPENV